MGEGVVIGGRVEPVLGLEVLNYRQTTPDNSNLKLRSGEDMRNRRTRWVRGIVWHTTKGIETKVEQGIGPNTNLEDRIARLWATDGRAAGAHLSVDWDGTVGCHADLLEDATYHARAANEVTIGIELYQDKHGKVYSKQLEAGVRLTGWLCRRFGIQLQMPRISDKKAIPRLAAGGKDFVGVYGHRHVGNRGPGDPGDHIFKWLKMTGFQEFRLESPEQDITFWMEVQDAFGLSRDGIPGPVTCDTLRDAGYAHGLWMPVEADDPQARIE